MLFLASKNVDKYWFNSKANKITLFNFLFKTVCCLKLQFIRKFNIFEVFATELLNLSRRKGY